MPHPRYELTTIGDVLLVPAERRKALFDELALMLLAAELALGEHAHTAIKMPFIWTDDDIKGGPLSLNGKPWLQLEVTRAGSTPLAAAHTGSAAE